MNKKNTIDWMQFGYIKLCLFFLLVCSSGVFSQRKTDEIKAIDSLIEETNKVYMNYESYGLIPMAQDILKRSKKADYEKGLVYGNFYIATALGSIGNYKESIRYIQKSQAFKEYLNQDLMQSSRNYGLLGDNYLSLELYSLCSKNYQKTIDELRKVKVKDEIIIRTESSTYFTFGKLYMAVKKYDSVFYSLKKAEELIRNINSDDIDIEKNLITLDFGNYYLDIGKLDSAQYYFQKAISDDKKEIPVKLYAYQSLGELQLKKGKYKEAEKSFLMSASIMKKHNYPVENFDVYKNLSTVYYRLNDLERSAKYTSLYNKHQDSLTAIKKLERDAIIKDIMKMEKDQLQKENKRNLWTNITLGIIFTLLLSLLIYKFTKKNTQKLIEEKDQIVSIKEVENVQLKQKLNEAFDEVYQMAKENNPAFWIRFQEVYPRFKENLSKINPDLKVSDLTFCAYIYLGFSSKEISDYTFKASKTIENYRYNVRKKLELLPEKDLMMSIKEIADR